MDLGVMSDVSCESPLMMCLGVPEGSWMSKC